MKHHVLTESIELHPIGSCFSDNVGNSGLREILREYFGKNEISYTADYSNEIWGEVMQFLERNCKFIKDIELSSGLVSIYETDVVNEFLVRFELENGGKNFVFWKKESTNSFVTIGRYLYYKYKKGFLLHRYITKEKQCFYAVNLCFISLTIICNTDKLHHL